MIYIFDKTQAIIKVLTNDDFTAAHLNFKINTATTFEFSLPASKALPSGSKYVATPHPLDDSKFIMLRLTERVDNTETIDYSAYELAYQELATDGYIEDKRPQNQSALNLMKIALDGSNWELNNVNVSGTATTNFYYVDRLSAISKVVDLLGGEIVFYIEIQGNAISGRYMDYLARQGANTSKVFASGSNLLTVERQSDTSNIYTAILPRGKGEEIDNGEADTPDGYGRRINIADVEWKKSAGKPLDKPKGSIVLSDPDATAEWGQINGNARLLLQTYDDIDDVNVLINSAYKTLQSVNHPQIQYSATVADVGGLSLGDTVLIMHGDRDLSYKTRVFEVKYDLLSPDQTELSLGDDLSSNSITSQINNVNAVADTTSSQTQWTINQIGRPGTTYGATAPDSPKVGDIWFKYLADGGTEIYRWNGDIWELLASPTTADDMAAAVDDAVTQAKAHVEEVKQGILSDISTAKSQAESISNAYTDAVKQGLSSDIATAKSQAASLASTAEANAKSEATSQFNQAKDALAEAKTNLQNDIDESKGNIVEINETLTGFDGTLQRVQDAVNGLGQINQLMNTEFTPDLQGWTLDADKGSNAPYASFVGYGSRGIGFNTLNADASTFARLSQTILLPNTRLSVDVMSLTWRVNTRRMDNYCHIWLVWQDANGVSLGQSTMGNWNDSTLNKYNVLKWENISIPVDAKQVDIRFETREGTNAYIFQPMVSFTDTIGAYVQGNYNNNDALAKVKLTADQASLDLSTYTQDADGRIKKAQSGIEANATAITKKVSQTDYDNKTGELSNKLNTTTDTADGTKQALSDYKEYANGNISGVASDLRKVAGEVDLKLTKTDYDDSQSKLNTSLSQWKADYDGWTGTVSKLSDKVNNLGQVNQLMNTEFNPDLEGWTRSSSSGSNLPYRSYWQSNIQATIIGFDTRNAPASTYVHFQQTVQLPSTPGSGHQISMSWYSYAGQVDNYNNLWVRFYDNSNTKVSEVYCNWADLKGNSPSGQNSWNAQNKWEGIDVPDTATYVVISVDAREGTSAYIGHPMLVFGSTVGTYVQGNYNNNAALAQVKVTADSISSFVRDSNGNLSSNFQTALGKTSIVTGSTLASSIQKQTATQISSALTDNNGKIISLINQDSSGVQIAGENITLDGNTAFADLQQNVNSLGQINQLFNTEFSPDLQGWTLDADKGSNAPYASFVSYGSRGIGFNTANADANTFARLSQTVILPSTHSSTDVMSLSWRVNTRRMDNYCHIWLVWQDANGVSLGQSTMGNWNDSTLNKYNVLKWENISIPVDAKQVDIRFETREGTNAYIFQPMVSFTDTIGAYVQGNYNNNAALAQVKVTADGISNFVRDSSGNLSYNFQTALSRTSIITDSTLATSIQKQTSSQISSALTDNNGKIISLINQDSSGVQIAGKNIVLDGDTTVTGDFYAKGGNFKNLNASNLTVGTLNGSQVNITNINANNIVSGAITGININASDILLYNDNSKIHGSYDWTDLDEAIFPRAYDGTWNLGTRRLQFYGKVTPTNSEDGGAYNSYTYYGLDVIKMRRLFATGNIYKSLDINAGKGEIYIRKRDTEEQDANNNVSALNAADLQIRGDHSRIWLSTSKIMDTLNTRYTTRLSSGKVDDTDAYVHTYTLRAKRFFQPYGYDDGQNVWMYFNPNSDDSNYGLGLLQGDHIISSTWAYNRTYSFSPNLFVSSNGYIGRTTSASKYKLAITRYNDTEKAEKLLSIDPARWFDKSETEEYGDELNHKINDENSEKLPINPHFGLIAEDLEKAGLDEFVSKNHNTGEIEGLEYDRVWTVLIPYIRELNERIKTLEKKYATRYK